MRRFVFFLFMLLFVSSVTIASEGISSFARGQTADVTNTANPPTVSGTFIHELEIPADVAGNPSLAQISNKGMSCAVSFANNLGSADNFGMVVYSETVSDTVVIGQMALQWGRARSITTENGEILESAVYDYAVIARDESGMDGKDSWSMTLWGKEQMFNGVTFAGPVTVGDLVVKP